MGKLTVFVQVLEMGSSKYLRLPPEVQEFFGNVGKNDNIRIDCEESGKATITLVK